MTGKDILWFVIGSLVANTTDVVWHLIRHTPRTEFCSIQTLIIVAMVVIVTAIRADQGDKR